MNPRPPHLVSCRIQAGEPVNAHRSVPVHVPGVIAFHRLGDRYRFRDG